MLDTDISSYIMRRSDQAVLRRLSEVNTSQTCVSVITKAELLFGVALSGNRRKDELAVEDYLRSTQVLEFREEAATHYADIRATLHRSGQMIGPNDLLIAAHARSLGLVLVSNNVREFGRVPGLSVENWTELL